MLKIMTLVHPDLGEVLVDETQWNSKFPAGEESHGWCEEEATARGWSIKEKPARKPKGE